MGGPAHVAVVTPEAPCYGTQQTVTGAVGVTPPLGCAVPSGGHAPATSVAPSIFAPAGLPWTRVHMELVGTDACCVPHAASPKRSMVQPFAPQEQVEPTGAAQLHALPSQERSSVTVLPS